MLIFVSSFWRALWLKYFESDLRGVQSYNCNSRDFIELVFNACVKLRAAFAWSICQRLASLDELAETLNAPFNKFSPIWVILI